MKFYNVGIYARLSREDEDTLGQSESIQNQIQYLEKYVVDHGYDLAGVYYDDGVSGTTFDRVGFKRLLDDIGKGKINMVITKDLSRLGRDITETSRYFQRFFPENNVRYIAVNDGFDTGDQNNTSNDFFLFKSAFDEMYASDISKKVRSVLKSKVEAGKFIGAHAPYGYVKDPANHNKLVVDPEAAGIVRRIFEMYISDNGLTKIAHMLNSQNVSNPTAYKASFSNYVNGKCHDNLWTAQTIKTILKSPTYAGHLTQRKFKKVHYKSDKLRANSQDEWFTVKNTHEAIIDEKDFLLVQDMMSRRSNDLIKSKSNNQLLSGFVFCGDCGSYMTFHKTAKKVEYMICSKYKRFTSKYCSRHAVELNELEQVISSDITSLIKVVIDNKELLEVAQNEKLHNLKNGLMAEITSIEQQLDKAKNYTLNLYQDKVNGIITQDEFIELNKTFSGRKNLLATRHELLKKQLEEKLAIGNSSESLYELIKDITDYRCLSREALEKLIEKVEIYEDGTIKIRYKFANPLQKEEDFRENLSS